MSPANILRISLLALLAACGASNIGLQPVAADVARVQHGDTTTLAELQQGYQLYLTGCGGCHTLYVPASHTREQWLKLLPEMCQDAKYDSAQSRLVKNYILSKL